MRQIKFRVWYKDQSIMDNWDLVEKQECFDIFSDNTLEVMQFTGLKDKKGNDVYEGDIITFSCPHCGDKEMAAVIWIDELACWGLANYDYPIGFPFQIPADDWESLVVIEVDEVVGNIYENPKLLK